ncbi:hypothetical protein Pcinc_042351 [Petrolisthes cinctipes]|uniref:Uncharacterized protein n=1 Tax=Petrolisthes cinctipes TaxID=88211 RepID=A0AAE1BHN5_PETCI|nr:hypothetical protein Pcinc_042351 [Petrolisthes cinctipes]
MARDVDCGGVGGGGEESGGTRLHHTATDCQCSATRSWVQTSFPSLQPHTCHRTCCPHATPPAPPSFSRIFPRETPSACASPALLHRLRRLHQYLRGFTTLVPKDYNSQQ